MVTISISEETRRKILSIAGDLQRLKGERVDLDEVISYLTDAYRKGEKRKDLFELFCRPVSGARFRDLYASLVRERRMDERRR